MTRTGDRSRHGGAAWAGPASLAAPVAIAASVLLTVAIGLLGPSAMVPRLPGPDWQPPYSLGVRPEGGLVIAMAVVALALGAAGLGAGLLAVRRGRWRIEARWLVLAGCAAAVLLAFLPPSGSSDHLNYAAYGRIASLGHDPYSTTAADLPGDPVAGAVEEWVNTPSVYGPVASAVQALAGLVGGESVRLTVFALAVANAAAFVVTALLLHRVTGGDPRAALMWAANPLLLYHLAAGMHVDTLAIAAVVAALALGVRAPARGAGTGVLLGLGIAVKVNAGLVALGPAWVMRRAPARFALVAGVASATVVGAYALAGPHSLDQINRASKSLTLASPWNLLKTALQNLVGPGAYVIWIQLGALLVMAALAALLLRAMPEIQAAHVAAAVVVAYLFAAPYALPWYDGMAFALVAMVPASALDGFLVVRLAALSLAYLPARVLDQPEGLLWLRTVVRTQVAPWILLAVTAALAVWAFRSGRAVSRARTRPASAAPRRSAPSPGSRPLSR